MSFSDETVFSKLNALNDTQEGIVAVAQWVMFHRRHAKRFVELWFQRLKESSPSKKLHLVYLANEVVQQMRGRKKEDFSLAFSPIMPDACEVAYKQSPADIQNKIRRVVDVWRQRSIFESPVLQGILTRLDDVDKGRSSGGGGGRRLGGGLGTGGTIPSELIKLSASQQQLNTKLTNSAIAFGSATAEFSKTMEAEAVPAPPVYAARLSQLFKTLDVAHTAVNDALASRRELIKNLEGLLETNKTALAGEEQQLNEILEKKKRTENMKRDVEQMILSGLNNGQDGNDDDTTMRSRTPELEANAVEALTPPSAEPEPAPQDNPFSMQAQSPTLPDAPPLPQMQPGADILSSLMTHQNYQGMRNNGVADQQPKVPDNPLAGLEGLDDDTIAMLRREAEKSRAPAGNASTTLKRPAPPADDDDDEYHP